jgi:hypothetical protein
MGVKHDSNTRRDNPLQGFNQTIASNALRGVLAPRAPIHISVTSASGLYFGEMNGIPTKAAGLNGGGGVGYFST